MTPRALLTVIGATAIAFAIAIGNAAGFAADGATTSGIAAYQHAIAAEDGSQAVPATPGTYLARALASAPRDCAIAL